MSARDYSVILIPDPKDAELDRRFYEERRRLRSQAFRAVFRAAVGALGRVLVRGIRAFKRRRDLRAAYDELAGLDDRMLRDIGIARGEIWNVVRGEPRAARETETVSPRCGRPVPGARRRLDRREAA